MCYAHANEKVVYPEIRWLQDQGINIWYDEGISAGRVWRAELASAVEQADRVLYFVSRAALASLHCNREVNYALDCGKVVVPIYLEDVELTRDLRLGLGNIQGILKHLLPADKYQRTLLSAAADRDEPVPEAAETPKPGSATRALGSPLVLSAAFLIVCLIVYLGYQTAEPPADATPEPDRVALQAPAGPTALVTYDSDDFLLVNTVLPLLSLTREFEFIDGSVSAPDVLSSSTPPELMIAFWCTHSQTSKVPTQIDHAVGTGTEVVLVLLDETPASFEFAGLRQVDLSKLIRGAHVRLARELPAADLSEADSQSEFAAIGRSLQSVQAPLSESSDLLESSLEDLVGEGRESRRESF